MSVIQVWKKRLFYVKLAALKIKILLGMVNCYDADPGSQAIFCGGHKITVTIRLVCSIKDLRTIDVQNDIRKKILKNPIF